MSESANDMQDDSERMKQNHGVILPWKRMTVAEAIERFGTPEQQAQALRQLAEQMRIAERTARSGRKGN